MDSKERAQSPQPIVDNHDKALDAMLSEQVNRAFAKLDSGDASFIDHETAKTTMADRKARIRALHQKQKFPSS